MPTVAEAPLPDLQTPPGDVGSRYVRAALHTGFGGVASRLLAGLTPVLLARYLGPGQYGVYTLVLSLAAVVAGVSHLGQNKALQKFLPEYSIKNPSRGGAILADTVVLVSATLAAVCILFFFLSPWIASTVYHRASLAPVFQFSALLILFLSLFNLASSAVAGLQDFKAYSRAIVLKSAAFLVLAWAGVWMLGLYGALGGQLLAALLGLAYLAVAGIKATRRRFPCVVRVLFCRDVLREIFSFGFPAFLSGLLVAPAYWWANTLLARHSGFEQVGLFGVAFALSQLILVVPGSVSIPAVSFMSESYAASESGKFSRLVSTNVRLIWALTLPISLGCALFAPWIVRIAFGSAYAHAAALAAMMSLVALVIAVGGVIGNAVAGSGHMWHALAINGFWLVAFCAASLILVPAMSARGLALAFVISYLLLAVALSVYAAVRLGVRFENFRMLTVLSIADVLLAVLLLRQPAPVPLAAGALAVECGTLAVEWRMVLSGSERRQIMGFATELFTRNFLLRTE